MPKRGSPIRMTESSGSKKNCHSGQAGRFNEAGIPASGITSTSTSCSPALATNKSISIRQTPSSPTPPSSFRPHRKASSLVVVVAAATHLTDMTVLTSPAPTFNTDPHGPAAAQYATLGLVLPASPTPNTPSRPSATREPSRSERMLRATLGQLDSPHRR